MRQYTNANDVWQRNYYEHDLRDEKSYKTISDYIANNPLRWDNDSLALNSGWDDNNDPYQNRK